MAPDDPSTKPPSSPVGSAGGIWPPAPESLQDYFPQYEIVALLGSGGMGAVYKGWQRSLDRFVAIKILPPGMDDEDVNYTERFKQEARSMAKLMHPGIVAVFDAGETPTGLLYFVMEFVEGTDVAQMVHSQGRLPPEQALGITERVCDALQYAHTHGIVHRDIKPANIMVNKEGAVKVADFGLAKHSDPAISGLTRTNMALGTPDYVAPETFIAGMNIDGRADIYAVGVMLYQMLTGNIPRGMFTMPSMTVKTDPRFDKIIARAMQTDREQRYESAAMLLRDLHNIVPIPIVAISRPQFPQKSGDKLLTDSRPGPTVRRSSQRKKKSSSPQNLKSKIGNPKPVYIGIGIAATVVVLGLLSFLFPGKNPASEMDSGAEGEVVPKPLQTGGSAAIKTLVPNSENATTVPGNNTLPAATTTGGGFSSARGFTNSLGMTFIPVPGTNVLFCEHETRVKDYAAYAAANHGVDLEWENYEYKGHKQTSEHPVVMVSWEDVKAFCAWLSAKEGKTYRLPTDHEWSVVVGLGGRENSSASPEDKHAKIADYPWGTSFPPPSGFGNYHGAEGGGTWAKIDGYRDQHPFTSPVKNYSGVKNGLYDLSGNVWEWCEDTYSKQNSYRVLRGGSWYDRGEVSLRSSYRGSNLSTYRSNFNGFRCVVSVGGSSAKTDLAAAAETIAKPALPINEIATTAAPVIKTSVPNLANVTTVSFTNSLAMTFFPVPGTDVLFCEHETRVKDYAAYAAANPGVNMEWKDYEYSGYKQAADHPVVKVSWEDAKAFCRWLSARDGKSYRLPTDHEWSIAVGIGAQEDPKPSPKDKSGKIKGYSWGNTWPPPEGAGNFSTISGYSDSHPFTAPVKSYTIGKHALYDMSGNVAEWCEDLYLKSQTHRVLRGGSWFKSSGELDLTFSRRGFNLPTLRSGNFGFRCVVSVGGSAAKTDSAAAAETTAKPAQPIKEVKTTAAPVIKTVTGNSSPLLSATKDRPWVNHLGMEFVPLPGSPRVFMCRTETRVRDFRAYASATGYQQEGGAYVLKVKEKGGSYSIDWEWDEKATWENPGYPQTENHAVTCVNWKEASGFCAWLSWLSKQNSAVTYRLPTDSEWSAAVGSLTKYPWGNEWPAPKGAGNYLGKEVDDDRPGGGGWTTAYDYNDGFPKTAPVAQFPPNRFGFYDLGGNVWEWCESLYKTSMNEADVLEAYPFLKEETSDDGIPTRVLRGGSWIDDGEFDLRSSYRLTAHPANHNYRNGFRCVVSAVR